MFLIWALITNKKNVIQLYPLEMGGQGWGRGRDCTFLSPAAAGGCPGGRRGLLGWLWAGEHCCLALTPHPQLCGHHRAFGNITEELVK